MSSPAWAQSHVRLGSDGTETGHGWMAAQDADYDQCVIDTTYFVRILASLTGTADTDGFHLYYSRDGSAYARVTATSTYVKIVTSSNVTEGNSTTNRLTAVGTFDTTNLGISGATNYAIASQSWSKNYCFEALFPIQFTSSNTADSVFNFRLYRDDGTTTGFTYSVTPSYTVQRPSYTQSHMRFRNDDGSESAATWKAAEDADADIGWTEADGGIARLRFTVYNDSIAAGDSIFTLWSSKNGGTYHEIQSGYGVTVRATSYYAEGDDTTRQLTLVGTFQTDNNGCTEARYCTSANYPVGYSTEIEYSILFSGTSGGNAAGDYFDFKLYRGNPGGTSQMTYSVIKRATLVSTTKSLGTISSAGSATATATLGRIRSLGTISSTGAGTAAATLTNERILGTLSSAGAGTAAATLVRIATLGAALSSVGAGTATGSLVATRPMGTLSSVGTGTASATLVATKTLGTLSSDGAGTATATLNRDVYLDEGKNIYSDGTSDATADLNKVCLLGTLTSDGVATCGFTPDTYFEPVLHHKCNENAGNTAVEDFADDPHNSVASANTSTLTVSGKINTALSMYVSGSKKITGSTDGNAKARACTDAMSFSFWLRRHVTNWGNYSSIAGVYGAYGWNLMIGSDVGAMEFLAYDGVGWKRIYPSSPSVGVWTHYVIVYDGENEVIYTNGVAGTPTAVEGDLQYTGIEVFKLGDGAQCSVDDARLYHRALSQDEIDLLYNSGSGTETTELGQAGGYLEVIRTLGTLTSDGVGTAEATLVATKLLGTLSSDGVATAEATLGKLGETKELGTISSAGEATASATLVAVRSLGTLTSEGAGTATGDLVATRTLGSPTSAGEATATATLNATKVMGTLTSAASSQAGFAYKCDLFLRCDDAAATVTVLDSSGNGRDGALNTGTTAALATTGRNGGAFTGMGASQYADNFDGYKITGSRAAAAFSIRYDDALSGWYNVIAQAFTSFSVYILGQGEANPAYLFFRLIDGGFGYAVAELPHDGLWHDGFCIFDKYEGHGKLYLDGAYIAQISKTDDIESSATTLALGAANGYSAYPQPVDGIRAFSGILMEDAASVATALRNGGAGTDASAIFLDGRLNKIASLAGTSDGVSTATCTLVATKLLGILASDGVGTATGTLAPTRTLGTLSSAGEATATGTLAPLRTLGTLSSDGVGAASATLSPTRTLGTLSSIGTGTASASLVATHVLVPGACDGVATATATLNRTAILGTLTSDGTSNATGSVTTGIDFGIISSAGTSSASATLNATHVLGTIYSDGAATATAELAAIRPLGSLSSAGAATASATLTNERALGTVSSAGTATASATLTNERVLGAVSSAGSATASATLTNEKALGTLSSAGAAVASATLTNDRLLGSLSSDGSSAATAGLVRTATLGTLSSDGAATATADLVNERTLGTLSSAATSDCTGVLVATKVLAGSSAGSSSAVGVLIVAGDLGTMSSAGEASASSVLNVDRALLTSPVAGAAVATCSLTSFWIPATTGTVATTNMASATRASRSTDAVGTVTTSNTITGTVKSWPST